MGNSSDKTNSSELLKVLTPDLIASLQAKTQYTEEKIKEWHVLFIRDCRDGTLDKKQFSRVYKRFYPRGKGQKFCKYVFDKIDTNGDGKIYFEEFLLAVWAIRDSNSDNRFGLVFDVCDISGDGQIGVNELTKLITAICDLIDETDRKGDRDPKHRAVEILERLGATGKKKLSKPEFIAGCKNDPVIRRLLAPIV